MKNKRAAVVGALIGGPLLLATSVLPASAEVSVGQHLTASKYSCGSNERTTGSETIYIAGVPVKQKAMIYRHCGSGSVRRRADVIFDADGRCMTISAGQAIVLHQVYVIPTRTVYRSSKAC